VEKPHDPGHAGPRPLRRDGAKARRRGVLVAAAEALQSVQICFHTLARQGEALRRAIFLFALCLSIGAGPAFAAPTHLEQHKVAASGHVLVLGNAYDVDRDCSPAGTVVIHVVTPPAHGIFANRSAMVFPSFPKSNAAHYHCNSRRVSGVEQTYVSRAGYSGPDAMDFIIIYPTGESQHIHITITVI
jgi:hypothetical protein